MHNYPKSILIGNKESTDDKVISEMFASQFKNNFSNSILTNKYNFNVNNFEKINRFEIYQNDIFNAVKSLKINKSSGPDKITTFLVTIMLEIV